METQTLKLDRKEALALYRDYKKHQHYSQPIDKEIQRTYQLISQGRVVIQALESIKTAGLNAQNLPHLAIARADVKMCNFRGGFSTGGATMWDAKYGTWPPRTMSFDRAFRFPNGTFDIQKLTGRDTHEAIVPMIPVHLRPKRALENYHILWEAEWSKKIPVDPMLLRRIGKADMWLVVAAWDLTPIERAAMAGRLNG